MGIQWDIIGHENPKKYLENSLISKALHHSYIFLGPKGVGKEKIARQYIKSILCSSKNSVIPCESCVSCKYFDQGMHPDFFEISLHPAEHEEKKKNISIEQVKEAQKSLNTRPLVSAYRGLIIDNAESLSEKASNALLKNLNKSP